MKLTDLIQQTFTKGKPKRLEVTEMATCIECKETEAHYWGENLCEECYRKMLEDEKERQV
jgi:hypothetical protein